MFRYLINSETGKMVIYFKIGKSSISAMNSLKGWLRAYAKPTAASAALA